MKFILVFLLLTLASINAAAQDSRICEEIQRNSAGKIVRSSAVLAEFQKIHPCPSTGLPKGSCPGWAKDHVIPLACGGCDSIENLQWMKNTIKSCAGTECKDRWERKIYCKPIVIVK
jgi:hypothetical protein